MTFISRHPWISFTIATSATAALFVLGNGMVPVWPLVWVAPLPVLLYATDCSSWRLSALAAAFAMLIGSLPMLDYLHFALHAPVTAWLVPFSLLSLLFAGGTLLFRSLLHRGATNLAVLALPSLWSLAEYLGSFVPANGTAGSLAYTQLGCLPVLQLASVTGPWGISFLLLLVPAVIAAAVHLWSAARFKALRLLGSTGILLTAVFLFGSFRLTRQTPGRTIKLGLLATDVVSLAESEPAVQALLGQYAGEALRLAHRGAQIVLMPEKTVVLSQHLEGSADALLQQVADQTSATLVIGLLHVQSPNSFNEARIYTPHQPITTYNKQHMLAPFESKLTVGSSLTYLQQYGQPIGVAICKDMDFVRPARDYGISGVALLLDPAWDFNVDRTWHGHIAIMRGVENGYAIAHTAKNGYLTATDNRGRILGETRSDSASFATLLVDVPLRHDATPFHHFGPWFPGLAALLFLAALARLTLTSRPESASQPPPDGISDPN